MELGLARGELRGGGLGERWPRCGAMVVREEDRSALGFRELTFSSHEQIDGGSGLGALFDVEVDLRELSVRQDNDEQSKERSIRVFGPSSRRRFRGFLGQARRRRGWRVG